MIIDKKNEKKNEKINVIEKSYTMNIYDRSLSCFDTVTSMNSGGVKLVLWAQAFPNKYLVSR